MSGRGRPRLQRNSAEMQLMREQRNARQRERRLAIRLNQTPEEARILREQRNERDRQNRLARRLQAQDINNRQITFDNNINRNFDHHISEIEEYYMGKMDVECVHCKARHFAGEKVCNKGNSFNDCCNHGKVILERDREFPPQLKSLFLRQHQKSQLFHEKIRRYNNLMSFGSLSANIVDLSSQRRGPFCYKIQGQIYRRINTSIFPDTGVEPSYGQLYFIDKNEALEYRLNSDSSFDNDIVLMLENEMREFNIMAQSFEMMKDEFQRQRDIYGPENSMELQLLFTLKPGMDRRRFNFQQVNEVAAVFSTDADGDIPEAYVTIRTTNTKKLQTVSYMDPCAEPWLYPLLYPHGNWGCHRDLQKSNSNRRVTRNNYVKYKIAYRENEFNQFLLSGRLFQQWLVDSYVKIEKDRIFYIKSNQKRLHVDAYEGVRDYIRAATNIDYCDIGKYVILPSTFVGSPRYMMQSYQDAMAIVRKFGKPDLFITMTCNPNWREIQENLLPHQEPSDRPDLIARVFELKKNHLIDLIEKEKIFGEVSARVHVIEFQKRGLPHIHLLVTLKSKLSTPEMVDKIISAEIPDPEEDLVLHEIVTKNMLHGPCGDWCMKDGKCTKKFPKAFNETTNLNDNNYPTYRRRNNGRTFQKSNGDVFDNRHVVPYCAKLSKMFNCHINVEVVSSVKAVKYLFKYIYKGHDSISMDIQNYPTEQNTTPPTSNCSNDNLTRNISNNQTNPPIIYDEIKSFVEGRYVSPIEATWRILERKLQGKSHSIDRLPVHLPNHHVINIPDDDINFDQPQIDVDNSTSKLMEYFSLNSRDEDAHAYTYSEIPEHYIFVSKNKGEPKKWVKRKQITNTFGRMYSVSPTNLELFHLRILLLHVKGATNFDILRTVAGIHHDTFTATCLALGLISDDGEWDRAMTEGTSWMMPSKLRTLFVRILVHCQPLKPEDLWEKFKGPMSEDFRRRFNDTISQQKAYANINALLITEGFSLQNFPSMDQNVITFIEPDETLEEQCNIQEEAQHLYHSLNEEQKIIVDHILNLSINPENYTTKCIFIDGPGGTGKTFIYKTIYKKFQEQRKIVCTMAFTGIAAILLPNGRTAHKTFNLPVPLLPDSTSSITMQSKEAEYLKKVDVFILDEAPMTPKYALQIMDDTLQRIMKNNEPFGGKIMLLGGDFRQLLPVLKNGIRSETVNLSIKFSPQWRYFETYKLTKNMRALPEEINFAKFLLDIGNGEINDLNDNIDLPERCEAYYGVDIADTVFKKIIQEKNYNKMASTAILSARNVDVDAINKRVVQLLDISSERLYTAIDSTENCDNGDMTEVLLPEYLNTLNPQSLPPYELRLRQHCIVMLIRNLSLHEGLCNGTRLEILELANNLLKCKILTGDKSGDIVFINRITIYSENDYPFTFKRRQFPIKLAFAMTINKAQGQTFENIGIDLTRPVFNHGQLYVSFSRVKSWKSLKLFLNYHLYGSKIKNIVYKEIFI